MKNLHQWLFDATVLEYREEEFRVGTPLEDVAEELRSGLIELHSALDLLRDEPSDELDQTRRLRVCAAAQAARDAFGHQITAFLSLHNFPGARTGRDDTGRLERKSSAEFKRWLSFIEREGSVTGFC